MMSHPAAASALVTRVIAAVSTAWMNSYRTLASRTYRRSRRYLFDPDVLADRDGIRDTADEKREKHVRERRSFFEGMLRSRNSAEKLSKIVRDESTGHRRYVDRRTGEVL